MALTDNLEQYFTFDNANLSGNDPQDISGNSNHGTNVGTATTGATGKILEGFEFNGSTDYIDLNKDYGTIFSTAFTFQVWIDLDLLGNDHTILSAKASPFGLIIDGKDSNPTKGFRIFDGSGWNLDTSTDQGFTTGSYQMLTVTYDGDELIVYHNADNVQSGTGITIAAGGTGDAWFAHRTDGSGGFFNGHADNMLIWSRVLSPSEVTEMYNSGDGLNPVTGGAANILSLGLGGGF